MSYLNVDLDYFEHPKTLTLIALLGNGAAELPLRLWAYCGKFKPEDGRLGKCSALEIESVLRWWGAPGKAVSALERAGFLSKGYRGYSVHDWKLHQGHIWALKMRNQAVAINRWKNIRRQASLVDTSGIPKDTRRIPYPYHPSKGSLPASPSAQESKKCASKGCGVHRMKGKDLCHFHQSEREAAA